MDSKHIRLLINNKEKELKDLRRLLEDLELKEAYDLLITERPTPTGSLSNYTIGTTVYYSKETRGKRRHYNQSGIVVKRDRRFLHIRDNNGKVIRRTPKYVRRTAIIEE